MRQIAKFLFVIFPLFCAKNSLAVENKIISGSLLNEFYNNYTYASNNQKNEFNKNYVRLELSLKININDNLYLNFRTSEGILQ